MGFMGPQVSGPETWYRVETTAGTTIVPADVIPCQAGQTPSLVRLRPYVEGRPLSVELVRGYGARLSAPGYLDATEWTVYPTEAEARESLAETYDLCPTCLADLDSEYQCPACEETDET